MSVNCSSESRLEVHCRALTACRACQLGEHVAPIVSAARRPRAMLVGQAPGQVEAAGGQPFAGRAGRTLFRWFDLAGFDEATVRDQVYISAITRCYPGPSASGRGDRLPSRSEQAECSRWLDAELDIIRPELIIPVGRLAIARFLSNRPLDQLIGRTFSVAHVGGTSLVVPLPHPSGASSWIHQADHPQLLHDALDHVGRELRRLGVRAPQRARSVA